jgi:hypothetical protein
MFGWFKKKPQQKGPDFSGIDSREKAEDLFQQGHLKKTMTEAEWLACIQPEGWLAFKQLDRMLYYLEDKSSARKFRLYQCAVLRACWSVLELFEQQQIEETERHFDTSSGSRRPAAKRRANKQEVGNLVEELSLMGSSPEDLALLRCIFVNPFRPVTISPAVLTWNDAVVVRLAQAAYEERHLPAGTLDNSRLAVLADALEEAGCTSEDILDHLRGPGTHVRGCWPVDLCLGKS